MFVSCFLATVSAIIYLMKKKRIVIGNWKMSPPTLAEAKILFRKVSIVAAKLQNVDTVICPPFVFLSQFMGTRAKLGAQDVFWQNGERFTGEISAEMLFSLGVSYCLAGHSERRALGETDEQVSKKVQVATQAGLSVVLCVGERERDANGVYFEFLKNQIRNSFLGVKPRFLSQVIIAYEPVWAIGKSFRDAMSPTDIGETAIFIRKVLSDIYGQGAVANVPILYGGSVETENVSDVLRFGGVAGALVGHKSLVAEEFTKILKIANTL